MGGVIKERSWINDRPNVASRWCCLFSGERRGGGAAACEHRFEVLSFPEYVV